MDYCPVDLVVYYLSQLVDTLTPSFWDNFREWLAATFLVIVAALALFQEPIKQRWNRAKLCLRLIDRKRFARYSDDKKARYYQIGVENLKPKNPAKYAKVSLLEIYKYHNGSFEKLPQSFPYQFVWSPSEDHYRDPLPTIIKFRAADFGYLEENGHTFNIALAWLPYGFDGKIHIDYPGVEPIVYRYGIIIEAENFVSKEPLYVEVAWDGHWANKIEQLDEHLTIREIVGREWIPN